MFEGFASDDFAAFEKKKRKYKKYDSERKEVREKMKRLRDSLHPIILKLDADLIPKISLASIGKRKKEIQSIWLAYVLNTKPSYTKNPQLAVQIGDGWLYIGIGIPSYTRKFRDNFAKMMIEDPETIRLALDKFNPDSFYFKTTETLDIKQIDIDDIQRRGREMFNTTGRLWVSMGVYYEDYVTILPTEPQEMLDHIAYVFEWLYPIFVNIDKPRQQNKRLYKWAKKALIESASASSEELGSAGRTDPFDTSGHTRRRSAGTSFVGENHKKLANSFFIWLKGHNFDDVRMEVQYIDIIFQKNGKQYIAELKPASEGDGRDEIREALGQLIFYSYYGRRSPSDGWFIVLDKEPGESEKSFISKLREELDERFNLAWMTKEEEFIFLAPLE
jgi:hypothetical protein